MPASTICMPYMMARNYYSAFLLLLFSFSFTFLSFRVNGNENITAVLELITDGYDNRVRPGSGYPKGIMMSVFVESLGPLHEIEMDFSVTFYLTMFWLDERLRFDDMGIMDKITLKSTDMDKFWLPDIHFLYEKKSHHHNVIQPNRKMIISADGTCEYSVRVSLTVLCNMDLDKFPMDTQKCAVHMMSYAYKTDEVQLYITDASVLIPPLLVVSKYDYLGYSTDIFNDSLPDTGFSIFEKTGTLEGIVINFRFRRQIQTYILTVYIPSILLVIISWMSFWIDAHAAPARVSLGITTVLTATTMTASMQESFPSGTNAKAIDVWLATCLIFVFLALIEYALANYLIVLQERRMKDKQALQEPVIINSERSFCALRDATYAARYRESMRGENNHKMKNGIHPPPPILRKAIPRANASHFTAENLDVFSRVAFALSFAFFNLGYWPYYLFFFPESIDHDHHDRR